MPCRPLLIGKRNKMKNSILFLLFLQCCSNISIAQQYRFTDGIYRIPYENSTAVKVVTNVWNHSPLGCFDIYATGSGSEYKIVAAAAGWIRAIRDFNSQTCGGSSCCNDKNNFIVLEHPNGEWSTYIHLKQNSITLLGHAVGNWVEMGTVLGIEGDVGCATGNHVHLEFSRPFNATNAWDNYDGVLRRHGELLNPVFCNISTGYLLADTDYTAGNCNYNCPTNISNNLIVTNQVLRADETITATTVFNTGGTGMYRAGVQIILSPGFSAKEGVIFTAQIKTCNQQN